MESGHRKSTRGLVLGGILLCLATMTLPGLTRVTATDPASQIRARLTEAEILGLYEPPGRRVFGPGLTRQVLETPERRIKVWVFFTDKGIATASALNRALADTRRSYSPKVLERRRSLGPDLGMDFLDLPVFEGYVAAVARADAEIHRRSRWLNGVSVTLPAAKLIEISDLPFVRFVQPVLVRTAPLPPVPDHGDPHRSRSYEPLAAPPGPVDSLELSFYGSSYNQLDQIQAIELHRQGYTGAGVRVLMLDTGFRKDHPVFDCTRLIAEWDFVNEDGNTQNEGGDHFLQHNHGTGVWAVTGGYDPGDLIGPAFAAEFLLAKTEDITQEVHAEEDNYVAALEWGDTMGVDVTTASLAYLTFDDSTGYTAADLDGDTAVITVAIDIAVAKGIACVNAMGNSGPGASSLWTPADADSVIAVGAVDSCGAVAGFSSRGPTFDGRTKPEICAKGYQTTWAVAATQGYGLANGTSLAAPLIGGLAALIKEAQPNWSGADIRDAITGTGTQNMSPDNDLGHGLGQGVLAMSFTGSPGPPRMTLPFHLESPTPGKVVHTANPTLIWTASVAQPGDVAVYTVLIDDNPDFSSPDTVDAGTDTTMVLIPGVPPGQTRWWKVEATGNLGFTRKSMNVHSFSVDAVLTAGPEPNLPPRFAVGPPSPNPMMESSTIAYLAPEGEPVELEVVSVTGRLVRRIPLLGMGRWNRASWDGRDESGVRAPSGVYFFRVTSSLGISTRKLVRLP